ncbi:MAG: arginase family protein [Thermoproteus sp.]|nr:arginase family protein [Thermoproteus sp.]
MEDTLSFKPGTRFAPARLRQILPYLEYNTPFGNAGFPCDIGDVELLRGMPSENLARIEKMLKSSGPPWIMIGGEHTATLAALRALRPKTYIHIDAHMDSRDAWPPGQRLSHATFVRRAVDELDIYVIYIAVRAYDDEELEFAKGQGFAVVDGNKNISRSQILDAISTAANPSYVSLDVDVMDPAEMPAVGTPEAGGLRFRELEGIYLDVLLASRPAAVDIMEYSPPNDTADIGATRVGRLLLTASKILAIL